MLIFTRACYIRSLPHNLKLLLLSSENDSLTVRDKLLSYPREEKDAALYSAAGTGIYDPPGESRSRRYFSIYAQGRLTICFPTHCMLEGPESISMDWTPEPGPMRYQADSKWRISDGSCYSLELTEINAADAEIYIPEIRDHP